MIVGDGPTSFHPGTMHNDTEHLDLGAGFLLECAIQAEAHLKQGTAEQISELDRHYRLTILISAVAIPVFSMKSWLMKLH